VIISRYGPDDPDVQRCEPQAAGFLPKPFGLTQLRAQLERLHIDPAGSQGPR